MAKVLDVAIGILLSALLTAAFYWLLQRGNISYPTYVVATSAGCALILAGAFYWRPWP